MSPSPSARRSRRVDPLAPLVRPRRRIGSAQVTGVVAEIRAAHERAGHSGVERMPDETELYSLLLWSERHAAALDPAARRQTALGRVLLWEHLHAQADRHQLRAVDDARDAGATWADLVEPLAVGAPSGAVAKTRRLRAEHLNVDGAPVRRTPQAVTAALERAALDQAAADRQEQAARRRHHLVAAVASRLLDHRAALNDNDDGDVAYWIDEIAACLPDSAASGRRQAALETYVAAVARHLARLHPRASTPDALAAAAAAIELA